MKPIHSKCDECKHEWYIQSFDVEEIDKGVTKTSFTCPSCKREYLVYYADAQVRKLQAQIRKQQQVTFTSTGAKLQRIQLNISMLSQQIANRMNMLKKRYA